MKSAVALAAIALGAVACAAGSPATSGTGSEVSGSTSEVESPSESAGFDDLEPVTLRAVLWTPPDKVDDGVTVFNEYVERVNEASGGKVTIEILGGPEVVPVADQFEAVRSGSIADITLTYAFHTDLVPEIETAHMSELMPWEERESGYFDMLTDAHEEVGVTPLGRGSTGAAFHIFSTVPIRSLDDFQGLTIRSNQGYDPFLQALGTETTNIGISEVFGALDQGLVEAAPFTVFGSTLGLGDVTDYLVDPGFWQATTLYYYINSDKLASLPIQYQDLLKTTAAELEHDIPELVNPLFEAAREELIADGLEFIELPTDDTEEYLRLSRDGIADRIVADGGISADRMAEIREMQQP